MPKPSYHCTQQELYTIARLAWSSCKQHLNEFADFKARYTTAYIDDRLQEIEKAAYLPDDQARNEKYETLRIQLAEAGAECLKLFQYLKRYIADAYPEVLHKTKTDAAGQAYYEKAMNNNWDSMQGLVRAASSFIAANHADLSANQNMAATFPTRFDDARKRFELLHNDFLQAEENAQIATQNKIMANNDLHTKLMTMLLDGQELFKNTEAIKKQFIFSELLYKASGVGSAGIAGYITDISTGLALSEVSITLVEKNKTTLTDNEGRYEILQIPAGLYTIKIEKQGYQTQIIEKHEIKIGTTSRINTNLVLL